MIDVPHEAGCAGHHCLDCGCCLLYDPDEDPDFDVIEEEDEPNPRLCCTCQIARGEIPEG